MKCYRTFYVLVLGIILPLLLVAFPVIAVHASTGVELITLYPDEGKIGKEIDIEGNGFDEGKFVYIYFSSDKAEVGDDIDDEVTAYNRIGILFVSIGGDFSTSYDLPDELTDGQDKEDVHGGDYYVYATYRDSERIRAVAKFTVIDGEIEVDPEQGAVGTEVKISGEGLRNNQEITVDYEGDEVDIASGDTRTDSDGQFICTIIIPESTAGNHTITVTDESGNKPEAEFSVKPKITIDPTSQVIGKAVKVTGTGFGEKKYIIISFDGDRVLTDPRPIHTNQKGSFSGSFNVPTCASGTHEVKARHGTNIGSASFIALASISLSQTTGYVGTTVTVSGTGFKANQSITITFANIQVGTAVSEANGSFSGKFTVPSVVSGTHKVEASDGVNTDSADFTVSVDVSLSQTTGNVGTEITVSGIGFAGTVTIKYDDIEVATTTTDASGAFSAVFSVPPSVAGSHAVTASDNINAVQTTFVMESEAPLMPAPRLPKVAATAAAKAHFDWEDVEDPSGVTYTLQVALDADFTTIVLAKEGLPDSEYTLTEEEKLESTEKEAPYYWRVKAVDGASNESEWITPRSFYVGFSWRSIPSWAIYVWIGLGASLLTIFGFWLRRRLTK